VLVRKLLNLEMTDAQIPTAPHHSSPRNKSGTSTPLYPLNTLGVVHFHLIGSLDRCPIVLTAVMRQEHITAQMRENDHCDFINCSHCITKSSRIVDTVKEILWFKVLKVIIKGLK